jgi:hypothetical protein
MQHDFQNVTIIPATAGADLLEAGIKDQERLYLAWDQQARRLFVVQWDLTRWICSCGKGTCAHKLRVNDILVEKFQQQHATMDDLATHRDDEQRKGRHGSWQ